LANCFTGHDYCFLENFLFRRNQDVGKITNPFLVSIVGRPNTIFGREREKEREEGEKKNRKRERRGREKEERERELCFPEKH
jgi:hypothetical protein